MKEKTKVCTDCGHTYPLGIFNPVVKLDGEDGRETVCSFCSLDNRRKEWPEGLRTQPE